MALSAVLTPIANRILSNLPREEFVRLLPHMEHVQIEREEILYNAGDDVQYAYFPNSGMISLLSTTEAGSTIEVAMIGDEGVVGIPVILRMNKIPYDAMIQISIDAIKIRGNVLREEFDRGGEFQDRMLRYIHTLVAQISQSAVCNRFHTVEKRLCRWLLVAHDRVKSETLDLTQEIIAHMLGTPRTGVTMAAVALQRAGVITYSRGRITILNRPRMESMTCECYQIVKESVDSYLEDIPPSPTFLRS
jgi:CRP-like cAMP-binding protein